MTAGRGWIALALVVFASWRPGRLVIGAYLFGAVTILQLHAQGCGRRHPLAVHVVAALSRDRHRAGADLARANAAARPRRPRSAPCSCRPLISFPQRGAMGRRASGARVHPVSIGDDDEEIILSRRLRRPLRRRGMPVQRLAPPTSSRSASSISARSATSAGPISTTSAARRWSKELGDKVETTYLENVREGPDCRARRSSSSRAPATS